MAAAVAAILSALAQAYAGLATAVPIAIALAVVGVLAERGRAQLTSRHEPAGLMVTRVDRLTNPLDLGVHLAAALDGDQVPPFVPRDRLPDLVAALDTGGFVLVVGDSTAGKTRLAYEAMRTRLPRHMCVVPKDPDTLHAALAAAKINRPSVLWLDDLDDYLGVGGLTRTHVTDLNTLVLATIRTDERERLSRRHDATRDHADKRLARAGRELLDVVTTEIHLDRMWSAAELSAAASSPDARIGRAMAAADRHGIAELLAAGPDLARELRDAWDTHPRAAALVTAGVDVRRAGCHRPTPLDVLQALHESYLAPGARPEPWDEALTWATQPLHGTSSLLEPVAGGYLAFDYLLDRPDPVPDAAWAAIVEFASPVELLEVASEAAFHDKPDFLRAAVAKALANTEYVIAANIAYLLGDLGFDDEARELLATVIADAGDAIPAEQRIWIRTLHTWRVGELVGGRGDPTQAFDLARDLVQDSADRLGATAVETYRARLVLVRNTPDPAEALRAARELLAEVTARFGAEHEITLSARFEEAAWAREAEGPQAAVHLYEELLDIAESLDDVDPSLVVDSQWNLGGSLLAAGEPSTAADVLDVAMANAQLCYGATSDRTLRIRLTYIRSLEGAGRVDEALELARELASDAERVLGPDHQTTSDVRDLIGELTGG